ncbi:MAG: redoxin family protein [Bacteroidia bacterium]|nr:redoxin family protein [Bacteroidia bacterium]
MFRFKPTLILIVYTTISVFCVLISTTVLSQNSYAINTHTIYNTPLNTIFIKHYSATVVVFLAPECPICIDYTPTLNKLSVQLKHSFLQPNKAPMQLIGVFSGNLYSALEYQQFAAQYRINFPLLNDANKALQHALHATHTPYCVLVNNKGEILYSGKIDNKNEALGAHKNTATIYYLQDNIYDYIHQLKLRHASNTPVGCLIE